jgi:hypothetical protein
MVQIKFEGYESNTSNEDTKYPVNKKYKNANTDGKVNILLHKWHSIFIQARGVVFLLRHKDAVAIKVKLFGRQLLSGNVEKFQGEEAEKLPWYIIAPHGKFKMVWNIFILLFLFYTIIFVPFSLAFLDDDDPKNNVIL